MNSQTSTLENFESYSGKGLVISGNGDALRISHICTRKLTNDVNLLDVLVVPHITKNLLSISKLTNDYPVDVIFSYKCFTIQNLATNVGPKRVL